MSFKRKAQEGEIDGIAARKSSKRAKIPVTKTVGLLSDKFASTATIRVWEPPANESTKDFGWTSEGSPFVIPKHPREALNVGLISSPIRKLSPSPKRTPRKSQSKSPSNSPWFYISSIRDGDSPYDDDVFARFRNRSDNFTSVVLRPLEISSSHDLEELDLRTVKAYQTDMANHVLFRLENEIQYYDGKVSKHKLPFIGLSFKLSRKHVAYGDAGLTFTFDGTTVGVKPWIPLLEQLRDIVNRITNIQYNFVVIHRFKNGVQQLEEAKRIEELCSDADNDSSVSFLLLGHARIMTLRRAEMPKKSGFSIPIETGTLIVSSPILFYNWMYAFPANKAITNPTIIMQFVKKINRAFE